jgi:hypothetical protein
MNKPILIGAAMALALTGCANMPTDGGKPLATSTLDDICATAAVRCIDVVVQNGAITQVLDADFTGPNHLILWRLSPATAPYTFPDKGIELKASSPVPPANEFNCRPVAQRHLFFCSNRNTVARTYTYTVTLKDAAGNSIAKDPRIFNN